MDGMVWRWLMRVLYCGQLLEDKVQTELDQLERELDQVTQALHIFGCTGTWG